MGKVEEQLHLQRQQIEGNRTRSTICCESCSVGLSRIGRQFNVKCAVVLIFSVCAFLSAIFWVLPRHSRQSGFDAIEAVKLSATVQAYFKLQKPVSVLVPHIARLEYDINGEIGVPFTKVAVLSMHRAGASNLTDVIFGVLSDPMDSRINSVSLSVLKSSLIELFLEQINLTLSTSIFGQPSSFEILEFPGGITVIPPEQSASIWQIPQILFNFTLYNSIYEIKENFIELKEQLKLGLHLRPYENVYVQVTNKNGSTRAPPVTVQASVTSDLGILLPQRLKQLAETITGSPAKNLGLSNSVFGKVKEIRLSSFLNRTLDATPPTPSPTPAPAPSPEENDYAEPSISPYPSHSPSYSPVPSPNFHHSPPCLDCDASSPSDDDFPYAPRPENGPCPSLPPISSSPAPSIINTHSPRSSPHCGSTVPLSPSPASHSNPTAPTFSPLASAAYPPSMGPPSQLSPDLSPLPAVSYGSSPGQDKGNGKELLSPPPASPSISPSPSSFATGPYKEIWLFGFLGLLTFHLLCW
ncbi:uncharacterized protein LOC132294351 [Cornus florida]|uniref:uncharacterized protein LOC132294351 n=1 Tax=Cornus florida TaxID=4283 RepID=UPI0028A1F30C|nr:uncharacterized protein LOC132294351 [Cornus florida]